MDRISNLEEYWKAVVLRDIEDHIQDSTDLRKAMHVAISLYHVWDWGKEGFTDWPDHKAFYDRSEDFRYLRDICNAFKHLQLDYDRRQTAMRSAEDIRRHQGAFDSKAFDNEAFDVSKILIDLGAGRTRNFTEVIRGVKAMWSDELGSRGLI